MRLKMAAVHLAVYLAVYESRTGRSTIVTAVFIAALTVGAVGVTAFVLYTVFSGWNTDASTSRHGAAKALVSKGRPKATVSPKSKGPYTPRWYTVLGSNLTRTSTAVEDITFTNQPINDTSMPNSGPENDVVQPVTPAVGDTEPSSSTTEKVTEAANPVPWTKAEGEPFATESPYATTSRQDDITSEPNTEYGSRGQADSVRGEDDTGPRSQVVSSTVTAAEEGVSNNYAEDESAREIDAVEMNFNEATSDASTSTQDVTGTVPRDQTRIVSHQGTNYEPAERDIGDQSGDERLSSGEARSEVTAANPRDVGHEIQAEEPDYDAATSPYKQGRDSLDPPTAGASESPITEAVSERQPESVPSDYDGGGRGRDESPAKRNEDAGVPESDDGVLEDAEPFSTDQRFLETVFPEEVTNAHPSVGGAGEMKPPYPNEDVTGTGIDPADIEAAHDDADIRDNAHSASTRVTTYIGADPSERAPRDVQTRKGKRMTGFHVTLKGPPIYTQGGSEEEPFKTNANSDERSSSTTAAWVVKYGEAEDDDISSISDEEEEMVAFTTQQKIVSGNTIRITTKDHFKDTKLIGRGSRPPSQNPGAREVGPQFRYSTSQSDWDGVKRKLGNTAQVGDGHATTGVSGVKIALATRYKGDDEPSISRETVSFHRASREVYSFSKESLNTEPLATKPTTAKSTDNTPVEPQKIDETEETTYPNDDIDWSEVGSIVPERRDVLQMSVPANRGRTHHIYIENGTVIRSFSTIAPVVVTSKKRPLASRPRRKVKTIIGTSLLTTPKGVWTQRPILGKRKSLVDVRVYTTHLPVPLKEGRKKVSPKRSLVSVGRNASTTTKGAGSTRYKAVNKVAISRTNSKYGRHAERYRNETSRANATLMLPRHSRTTAIVRSNAYRTLRGKKRSSVHKQPRIDNRNSSLPLAKLRPVIVIAMNPRKVNSTQHHDRKVAATGAIGRRNVAKRNVVTRERLAATPLLRRIGNLASTFTYVTRTRREPTTVGHRHRSGANMSSTKRPDVAASTTHDVTEGSKSSGVMRDNKEKRDGGHSS